MGEQADAQDLLVKKLLVYIRLKRMENRLLKPPLQPRAISLHAVVMGAGVAALAAAYSWLHYRQGEPARLDGNVIPLYEAQVKDLSTNGTLAEQVQKTVDSYKEILKQRQAELIDLQKQLSNLDAQIKSLQK